MSLEGCSEEGSPETELQSRSFIAATFKSAWKASAPSTPRRVAKLRQCLFPLSRQRTTYGNLRSGNSTGSEIVTFI